MKRILLILFTAIMLILAIYGCSEKITGTPNKDISVGVIPYQPQIAYGDSIKFYALVFNTTSRAVTWYVNNDSAGNDSLGRIIAINDTSAWYFSPPIYSAVTFDSVVIKAVSQADTSKSGVASAVIRSASVIFVDSASGSDTNGKGTIFHPYRTLTKALSTGIISDGDTIKVGPGSYTSGEFFPLAIPHRVTIRGAGVNSTRIIAPSSNNYSTSAFQLNADYAAIRNLTISGTNQNGIAINSAALNDSVHLFVDSCVITDCYVGIVISAPLKSPNFLDIRENSISDCRYGIVTTVVRSKAAISNTRFTGCDSAAISVGDSISGADDSTNIQLTNNYFGDCYYGVRIKKGSVSFSTDTLENITAAGIRIESGGYAFLGSDNPHGNNYFGTGFSSAIRCVYNLNPDTIFAQYNTWPSADSSTIDSQYIYDDDENASSGLVIFMPVAE
jgi:hypothetical protein